MIQVKCDVQTRKAIPNSNLLGFETDNESNSIYFRVNPHISGTAEVYIERDQDTGYIVLDEASDSYYLPIKKSLVKQKGTVIMQLIITTSDEKVYTFDKITFEVKTSIKVDEEIPDEYPTWMEVGNARLAEFNEAIEETNVAIQEINEAIDDANQAIDDINEVKEQILEDKEAGLFDGFSPIATVTETQSGATISITDVNGTTTADVLNGEKGDKGDTGDSAKINGVNTLTIEAGDNITLNQQDSTLTISATDTTDYTDLTNKPSVNNVELNGNKTLAELGIKQTYTKTDVGLGNVDNIQQYSANNPPPYPVTSVNSLTGNVIIDTHDDLIPAQASSSNQLADRNFVNSSIATSTATFRGTYDSLAELEEVAADENDYGFVVGTDATGNTVYNRYKYTNNAWVFEYALNNSSFTADEWAAIQSGITSDLVAKLQGIEANAQVNVIEGVKVGNITQAITNKVVEIPEDTTPTEGSSNVIDSNSVYEIEKLLPTNIGTGEIIDIDNAEDYKVLSVIADGKYQQNTTTGINLIDFNEPRSISSNTTLSFTDDIFVLSTTSGSYRAAFYNILDLIKNNAGKTLSIEYESIDTTNFGGGGNIAQLSITYNDDTPQKYAGLIKLNGDKVPFEIPVDVNNINTVSLGIYCNNTSNSGVYSISITKPILFFYEGTIPDYEPYTNGASPNPNYSQAITQVTSATWNRAGKQFFQNEYISTPGSTINAKLPTGTYTLARCDGNTFNKNIYIKLFKNNSIVTTSGHLTSDTSMNFSSSSYSYYGGAAVSKIIFTIDNDYEANIGLLEADGTKQVMLVKGSTTERTYEPYQGQSITIDLDGNEVCAVSNTIKDKLLVDRYGNVAIQKNVGKRIINGSEGWIFNGHPDTPDNRTVIQLNNSGCKTTKYISSHFIQGSTTSNRIVSTSTSMFISIADSITGVLTTDTQQEMLDKMKSWLNTYNVDFYYALETSQIIPLPKLNILPTTLKGINHIWLDTNLGRTEIEIEYVEDLSMAIPTSVTDLTDGADYVKFTDFGTTEKAGTIKSANSMVINSNTGAATASVRTYAQYESAGDSHFIGKGTLENVITGKGLVSNVDYAGNNTAGVVKWADIYFTNVNNVGQLQAKTKTYEQYTDASDSAFIGKGTLENVLTGKGYTTFSGDYDDLTDKPAINNVELSGNKTTTDLGINTHDDLIPTDIKTGEQVTVEKAENYNVVNIVVDGKYTQGDNPSPTNPQPMVPVTSVTINRTGKNRFNVTNYSNLSLSTNNSPTNVTKTEDSFSFTSSGTTSGVYFNFNNLKTYISDYNPDETYNISLDIESNGSATFRLGGDNVVDITLIKGKQRINAELTFVEHGLTFYNIGDKVVNYTISKIMISTVDDIDFEAFDMQSIPVDLDGNVLRATSAYKDKLLIDDNGNVLIQKNVDPYILNGTETYSKSTSTTAVDRYYTAIPAARRIYSQNGSKPSNLFPYGSTGALGVWYTGVANGEVLNLVFNYAEYNTTTKQDFVDFVTANNIELWLPLLESQIIELPNLPTILNTLKGVNHIWASTNIDNTSIQVEYVRKISSTVSDLEGGSDYVKIDDWGTATKAGTVKASTDQGISISTTSGKLLGATRTYAQYTSNNGNMLISKATLENVITGKELVDKTYVDGLVGDIEAALTTLDEGGGV